MPIQPLYFGVVLLLCCSCQKFVLQKENKEEVLKEEWGTIHTDIVAQPPLFEKCNTAIEAELTPCFQNTIIAHVQQVVSQKTIVVRDEMKDTLWLPIHIDKKGLITVKEFTMPLVLEEQFPEFKNMLVTHIATLPKVSAATSRGIPVTTTYKLPIVLRSE